MVVKSKLSTLALMALPAPGKFTHPVGFAGGVCSCRFDPEVVFDDSAAVPLRPFACFISCSASNQNSFSPLSGRPYCSQSSYARRLTSSSMLFVFVAMTPRSIDSLRAWMNDRSVVNRDQQANASCTSYGPSATKEAET